MKTELYGGKQASYHKKWDAYGGKSTLFAVNTELFAGKHVVDSCAVAKVPRPKSIRVGVCIYIYMYIPCTLKKNGRTLCNPPSAPVTTITRQRPLPDTIPFLEGPLLIPSWNP